MILLQENEKEFSLIMRVYVLHRFDNINTENFPLLILPALYRLCTFQKSYLTKWKKGVFNENII